MLVRNAVRVLAPLAEVKVERRRYQATIRETIIEFDNVKGQVTNLRCYRGKKNWRPKNMTNAIRFAMNRFKNIPKPEGRNLLLNVFIDHRGVKFEPIACFLAMASGPLGGAADEWNDKQALEMAEAIISGQKTPEEVLDWLTERGGAVATAVEQARGNRCELDPEEFVYIWTTSDSADEATCRMSRMVGMNLRKKTVIARASRYRSRGVRLKRMRR